MGSDTLVECSCATFATGVFGQGQSSCCHSRLLEIVKGFESTRMPSFINKFKIRKCQELATREVLVLPSKSGVDRFSIKLEKSAEFAATLFHISRTSRAIVKCHSSECKISEGSCRIGNTLHNVESLCPHLIKFRAFYMSQVLLNTPGNVHMDQENLAFEEYDECVPVYMPDEKLLTFALLIVFLDGLFSFVFTSSFANLKAISCKLICLSIFLLIYYVFIIIIVY